MVDFSGLAQIVDAVGGVTVENQEHEFELGDYQFPVGTLHLSGEEAVYYARYRGGPDGDYGRQKRQQQVVRALLQNGADLDLITAIPDILSTVRGHIRTDINVRALRDLAQEHRSTCTAESLETATIAGTVAYDWDDLSGQDLMFVRIDDEELQNKLSWLLGNNDALASTDDHLLAGNANQTIGTLPGGAWHGIGAIGGIWSSGKKRRAHSPVITRAHATPHHLRERHRARRSCWRRSVTRLRGIS